jgi:peroxiredoxin
MALPTLADAIFMQVISIRPNLLIMYIFAFLGLIIGLYFNKTLFHILALLCLFLLNALFVFYYFPNLTFKSHLKTDNRLLPDAVFVNSLADSLFTKDLKGKVVLIDMWYAKCGACFAQFNETEKIYQHFKNNPKVLVVGLNTGIDEFDVFLAANRLIRKKKNLQFPLWLDIEMSLSKKLDLKEFPQNIIINSKGQICYIHKGFSRDEENIYSRKTVSYTHLTLPTKA